MKKLFSLIFLVVVAVSCLEKPDCINKKNNIVGITFKSMNTNADTTFIIDSIRAQSAVPHFEAPGQVGKIAIPLDYLNDTTSYVMEIEDTVYHLVLTYTVQPEYVAEDCGERFVLNNLRVADHNFDSVRVVQGQPGIDATASNLQIFR